MHGLNLQERLQPTLLDRLIDEHPQEKSASLVDLTVSKNQLRQAVLKDLTLLLNTTRLPSQVDLTGFDYVQRSVINFGLPALAGKTTASLDSTALKRIVKQAIVDYEPRIVASTLVVELFSSDDAYSLSQIILHIRGHLWMQPVPIELLLRTLLNLETGQVEIQDLLS